MCSVFFISLSSFTLYPCSHLFFYSGGSAYSFLKFLFYRHLLSKFFLAILISCCLLSPNWLFCMLSWLCIWYLKSHLFSFLSGFLQPLSQLISHISSSYVLKIPSQATFYFLWNLFCVFWYNRNLPLSFLLPFWIKLTQLETLNGYLILVTYLFYKLYPYKGLIRCLEYRRYWVLAMCQILTLFFGNSLVTRNLIMWYLWKPESLPSQGLLVFCFCLFF